MSSRPLTVLIFGHSFIRRLRDDLVDISRAEFSALSTHDSWLNLRFNSETVSVVFHGIGGLTLSKAYNELEVIAEVNPDVIFIQLGENDVDKRHSRPSEIARQVSHFAASILRLCPKTSHLFWGQLLHRLTPRIGPQIYSEKIHQVNRILRSTDNITYWPHKGLWQNPKLLFTRDGVHLNTRGHHKLARSIRGAILRHRALTTVKSSVTVVVQQSEHKKRSVSLSISH